MHLQHNQDLQYDCSPMPVKKLDIYENLFNLSRTHYILKNSIPISRSDVYWDEIVAIIPRGKEMTYDLTIAKTHNFVANDFIVHNSHAACYAIIAFRTAYLKANFPVEFMTALLTAESRGTSGPVKNEKIAQAVLECKRLNLPILIPDINKSKSDFSIEERTKILFGLSAIKNVGEAAIQNILEARKERTI